MVSHWHPTSSTYQSLYHLVTLANLSLGRDTAGRMLMAYTKRAVRKKKHGGELVIYNNLRYKLTLKS